VQDNLPCFRLILFVFIVVLIVVFILEVVVFVEIVVFDVVFKLQTLRKDLDMKGHHEPGSAAGLAFSRFGGG
jgi:hypothetical protein